MKKANLIIGNHTDVGRVRSANEDYYGSFSNDNGDIFIVCDGVGGAKGGSAASQTAVKTIKKHFENLSSKYDAKEELKNAIEKANEELKRISMENEEYANFGTTVAILLIGDNFAYYAHVGDSRLYLVRDNQIYLLTQDHSYVSEMIKAGIITEEEAKFHPKKNIITRALGPKSNCKPDIGEPIKLQKDDIFILCTDGLSNYLDNNEIMSAALKSEPQEACINLVKIANDRGGADNITVQIVKVVNVDSLEENKAISKSKKIKIALIFLVAFFATLFAFLLFISNESLFENDTLKSNQYIILPRDSFKTQDNSDSMLNESKQKIEVQMEQKDSAMQEDSIFSKMNIETKVNVIDENKTMEKKNYQEKNSDSLKEKNLLAPKNEANGKKENVQSEEKNKNLEKEKKDTLQ